MIGTTCSRSALVLVLALGLVGCGGNGDPRAAALVESWAKDLRTVATTGSATLPDDYVARYEQQLRPIADDGGVDQPWAERFRRLVRVTASPFTADPDDQDIETPEDTAEAIAFLRAVEGPNQPPIDPKDVSLARLAPALAREATDLWLLATGTTDRKAATMRLGMPSE